MASATADVISVVGTVFTAVGFFQSLFPGKKKGASVSIRIADGYSTNAGGYSNKNFDGTIRGIYGYDAGGALLGSTGFDYHMKRGGEHTFTIDQGNNKQALYIDLVADNDAFCVATISTTQPDNGQNFPWVGNVFKACGQAWYYSNVAINNDGDDDVKYPLCGWLGELHVYSPPFLCHACSQTVFHQMQTMMDLFKLALTATTCQRLFRAQLALFRKTRSTGVTRV